jgi:hypothetical protein
MKNANRPWTTKDIKTIQIRNADGLTDDLIAQELGRSVEAVKSRRCALGLKKNDAKKRGPKPTPKKDAKYTSYKAQPRKTVRYLWGALEVTKF